MSTKLFSCSIPLRCSSEPSGVSPFLTLRTHAFQRHLLHTPAMELLAWREAGVYTLLALPASEWRGGFGLKETPLAQAEPRPPALEEVELGGDASVLLPARGLPWEACVGEASARSSLSPGLPVESSTLTYARGAYSPALDRAVAEACMPEPSLDALLERVRELEAAHGVRTSAPVDEDLWLDLLRCAGSPPPMEASQEALVVALMPALRFLYGAWMPQEDVTVATEAFCLWLRALRELGLQDLKGNDLFCLHEFSLPLIRLLVQVERPVSALGGLADPGDTVWADLQPDEPLGLGCLRVLRGLRCGAVLELAGLSRQRFGEGSA